MTLSQPRPTIRVPLFGLMAVVALIALGLAALARPTDLAVTLVVTITFAVLLGASCLALLGLERAFWVGVATVGWGYLFLATGFEGKSEPTYSEDLLPTRLLRWSYTRLFPDSFQEYSTLGGVSLGSADAKLVLPNGSDVGTWKQLGVNYDARWEGHFRRFFRIGHSLIALILGLFSGMVLVWIEKRRRKSRNELSC